MTAFDETHGGVMTMAAMDASGKTLDLQDPEDWGKDRFLGK